MASDAWKLGTVFTDHNTNFKNTDSAFNVITEKILDLNLAKVFLNGEAIAETLYSNFVDERLSREFFRMGVAAENKICNINMK